MEVCSKDHCKLRATSYDGRDAEQVLPAIITWRVHLDTAWHDLGIYVMTARGSQ